MRTLHHNVLFLLGLQCDAESILDNTGESANSGNPVKEQVDNFPTVGSDGEEDQPDYEGPQNWSHTKQLMKANVLMDQMFDINSGEIHDSIADIRDLILQFWYQQVFTVYMVCCDLAEVGAHSINC